MYCIPTRRVIATILLSAASAVPITAQVGTPPEIEVDPDLPVKEGFDAERAYLGRAPMFTPMRDPQWIPLRAARRDGAVAGDTPVLVFEGADQTLVLVTAHMSYHHVAQGEMAGEPWMVTF